MTENETKSLPESASQPLKPGESYQPVVPAETALPELTPRSILWGILLCVIFTVASAYSGLKVGQVMEAAIPISILAIGLARVYGRRSSLLENVIITGIGGAAGGVVAGAIFTLPALYILHLDPHPVETIFICLAGGCLGVLFLIPLRRYFVREMHGLLPYPEATAITEVLVTGEKGGSPARLLLQATVIAGVYDLFVTTFQVWKGVLSNFVLVPMIWFIGSHIDTAVYPAHIPVSMMTAVDIYRNYVRFIGVGAIATAGIVGIFKSLRVVAGSFGIALRTFRRGEVAQPERTDRDLPIVYLLLGVVLSAIGVAVFFGRFPVSFAVLLAGLVLTLLFSFFFTSVAANAIATTARNPVSGMTMLTIILSSVVLLRFGLSGTSGMFFVMAIAGMVCTALSISGQTITDLKVGYWLGSTPAAQEKVKFLGVAASAIAAGLTIVMLAHTFQFGEALPGDLRPVLASPQASIMEALVEGFMSHQPVAYLLFGIGAMITLVLEMLGQPSLIFALGMYLPLELNTPALVGGFLSHFLNKRSENTGGEQRKGIRERGVIIASGLMAGGALGGVLGAALRLFPWYREDLIKTPFYANDPVSQIVSALMFIGLCLYLWYRALRKENVV